MRKPCGFFIYQKDIANVDIIMIYCYQKATSYNWGCSIQLYSGWSESLCWGFFANKYAGCHNQQKINCKRNNFGMSHSRMGAILAFAILSLCLWSGWVHGQKVTEKWRYLKWCLSHLIFFVLVRENAKLRNNNTTASFLTHWRISKLTFWRTIKP